MRQRDVIKGCSHCFGTGRKEPRVFGVRIEDEDSGPSVVGVVAESPDDARDFVEGITGKAATEVFRA